jgi:hypothetical protein
MAPLPASDAETPTTSLSASTSESTASVHLAGNAPARRPIPTTPSPIPVPPGEMTWLCSSETKQTAPCSSPWDTTTRITPMATTGEKGMVAGRAERDCQRARRCFQRGEVLLSRVQRRRRARLEQTVYDVPPPATRLTGAGRHRALTARCVVCDERELHDRAAIGLRFS